MDAIKALLKGPPSDEPGPYIDWLYRLHMQLNESTQKHIAEIGRPLKQIADLLVKMNNASEKEQQEALGTINVWMTEAQGLALYAYLEEFRKAADAIAKEAKTAKPGPQKEQFERLDKAYREIFGVLQTTYNGALEGKQDALHQFPAAMQKAEEFMKSQLKN